MVAGGGVALMGFRRRDVVALVCATLLTRLAWQENWHVRATVHLLFYYPNHEFSDNPTTATQRRTRQENSPKDGSLDHMEEEREGGTDDESAAESWRHSFVGPAMLDVDGDGTAEAWAVLTQQQPEGSGSSIGGGGAWKIRILDLKPGQSRRGGGGGGGGPFLPPILLESSPITNLSEPVAVATGHLPDPSLVRVGSGTHSVESVMSASSSSRGTAAHHVDERTRHYFCGSDWHDASQKCTHPCPDGDSTKCPGAERCFADTPCDYHDSLQHRREAQQQESGQQPPSTRSTPAGSIPFVVTLWEHGVVRCDGLVVPNATHRLEIHPLWTVQPLANLTAITTATTTSESDPNVLLAPSSSSLQYWLPSSIQFIDPLTSGTSSGLILITANVLVHEDDDDITRGVLALRADTGAVLWESVSEQVSAAAAARGDGSESLPFPIRHPDQSSAARRRSLPPPPASSSSVTADGVPYHHHKAVTAPNCLHSFRRSLLTSGALPHYHGSDDEDVRSQVVHFDPQLSLVRQQPHQSHHKTPSRGTKKKSGHAKTHRQTPHKRHRPVSGKPNVVVTHTDRGLSVRSLKNGHELCRLSLWDQTLYADVNHDGLLDSLHVVTALRLEDDTNDYRHGASDPHQAWIRQLADQVQGTKSDADGAAAASKSRRKSKSTNTDLVSTTDLCHLQVLSGLPSREELFSTHVCGARRKQTALASPLDLLSGDAAPPLLMETYGGRRPGSDVVTAVAGVVTRVDGITGRKQWQLMDDSVLPHWEHGGLVLLGRVEADALPAHARPILLAGETGLAVLSPRGKPLASTAFPQPARSRPFLMDVNGDGVVDVVVVTTDAVWAYAVRLRATGTSLLRLTVGLLLIGVLLALVRNRFQAQSGKRSTDW